MTRCSGGALSVQAETPEGGHVLPWGANPAPEIGKDTHHVDEDCATGNPVAKSIQELRGKEKARYID
jgi:hypothetical protein